MLGNEADFSESAQADSYLHWQRSADVTSSHHNVSQHPQEKEDKVNKGIEMEKEKGLGKRQVGNKVVQLT